MTDNQIEQEIQAKGLTAPRITPADVEASIVGELYINAAEAAKINGFFPGCNDPLHLLTFCVLTLRNGFTVTGESACVSRENFDSEIGHKIARANAVGKVWPLLGYELRSNLWREQMQREWAAEQKSVGGAA